MLIARTIKETRKIVSAVKRKAKTIGFVTTMGALHAGHISLVRKAKKECDFVVVSIFVNPTQFGQKEDYAKYPKAFVKDRNILKAEGVDLIFYPAEVMMYPGGYSTYVEEGFLSKVLCGASRPGHFRGVCTIVAKLFNVVQPDTAYYGAKDYQQARVIQRMVTDLNFPLEIKVCPIVREDDGLAMSSRNACLDKKQRKNATCLFSALTLAKMLIRQGERDADKIIKAMIELFRKTSVTKVDYARIVDAGTLRNVKKIRGRILIALAVFIGNTRLIDNKELYVKK